MLVPNRRSSDPSLNEKWQDHRRSLELINVTAVPDGGVGSLDHVDGQVYADTAEPEPQLEAGVPGSQLLQLSSTPGVETPEQQDAELLVAVSVAEGQMENILQEATKEEAAVEAIQREKGSNNGVVAVAPIIANGDIELRKLIENGESDEKCVEVNRGMEKQSEPLCNGHSEERVAVEATEDVVFPVVPPLSTNTSGDMEQKQQSLEADVIKISEKLVKQVIDSCTEPQTHGQLDGPLEPEEPASHRTLTNGMLVEPGEPSETLEQANNRASIMESSTETLTDETCSRLEPAALWPCPGPAKPRPHAETPPLPARKNDADAQQEQGYTRTLKMVYKRPSLSAFQPTNREVLCNGGKDPDAKPCNDTSQWSKGERGSLSRQVSLASACSLGQTQRGFCHHRCFHSAGGRPAGSPEQPSRLHLDDDGLTMHPDAIQQRLRQMEACHQKEVESLKRQMQELRTQLENQQHGVCLQINGELGDEAVRHNPSPITNTSWTTMVMKTI